MVKVALPLSGGVDSSVVAALLKREGYQVIEVTMLTWNPLRWEPLLDIPLILLDLSEDYKRHVSDYFREELEDEVKLFATGHYVKPQLIYR